MAITSFYFLLFLALLLAVYYIAPGKSQNILLLIANFIFCYLSGGVRMIVFLVIGTLLTYAGALAMEKTKTENRKKLYFGITLLAVLGILIVFKYINFFVRTGNVLVSWMGIDRTWAEINIIAPLGLSFYMLQLLGYLIDVWRGTCRAQKNIVKYSLFATFFPQLSSGPINRYNDMEPQYDNPRKFDYTQVTFGMQRIAWGFFKKLVISERMAVIVNTVYGDYNTYSGFYIVFAAVCFVFQLYTDFSGYMDIALGTAQTLGIKMSENFEEPFFSKSISEFWRRWHITLGAWFKDYIFYPILKSELFIRIGDACKKRFGKKKGKKIPTWIGMVILWFLVGLWHGGAWNFIVGSGLLHCFYIVSGQILEPCFKKKISLFRINTDCFSYRLFQQIRTFGLVCISFIFFRASSFSSGVSMFKAITTFDMSVFSLDKIYALGLDKYDLFIGILALLTLLAVSIMRQKMNVREKLAEQNLIFRWGIYYILLFSIIIFGFYGVGYSASEFIYENF